MARGQDTMPRGCKYLGCEAPDSSAPTCLTHGGSEPTVLCSCFFSASEAEGVNPKHMSLEDLIILRKVKDGKLDPDLKCIEGAKNIMECIDGVKNRKLPRNKLARDVQQVKQHFQDAPARKRQRQRENASDSRSDTPDQDTPGYARATETDCGLSDSAACEAVNAGSAPVHLSVAPIQACSDCWSPRPPMCASCMQSMKMKKARARALSGSTHLRSFRRALSRGS